MSILGDEIRHQKVVADTVSGDLTRCASDLRTKVDTMDWTSNAATSCRARLTAFATTIDQLSTAASALAGFLDTHATSVETQEMVDAVNPASAALRPPPGLNPKTTCTILPSHDRPIISPLMAPGTRAGARP